MGIRLPFRAEAGTLLSAAMTMRLPSRLVSDSLCVKSAAWGHYTIACLNDCITCAEALPKRTAWQPAQKGDVRRDSFGATMFPGSASRRMASVGDFDVREDCLSFGPIVWVDGKCQEMSHVVANPAVIKAVI